MTPEPFTLVVPRTSVLKVGDLVKPRETVTLSNEHVFGYGIVIGVDDEALRLYYDVVGLHSRIRSCVSMDSMYVCNPSLTALSTFPMCHECTFLNECKAGLADQYGAVLTQIQAMQAQAAAEDKHRAHRALCQ